MTKFTSTEHGRFSWSVREEGNSVILEVECPNVYSAIELSELMAAGIRGGCLELCFHPDGSAE